MISTEVFADVAKAIKNRRTTKVPRMNGKKIPQSIVEELLQLADTAPTHGNTEPWRFTVFSGEALKKFCKAHGEMYWNYTNPETRSEATRDNLISFGEKASHLIIAQMKRTPETKIPFLEEYAATAAAVQNLLLGASAAGIAAIWNTGGMALKPQMKEYLQLAEEDEVVGFIYLGYTDDPIYYEKSPKKPFESKVTFLND